MLLIWPSGTGGQSVSTPASAAPRGPYRANNNCARVCAVRNCSLPGQRDPPVSGPGASVSSGGWGRRCRANGAHSKHDSPRRPVSATTISKTLGDARCGATQAGTPPAQSGTLPPPAPPPRWARERRTRPDGRGMRPGHVQRKRTRRAVFVGRRCHAEEEQQGCPPGHRARHACLLNRFRANGYGRCFIRLENRVFHTQNTFLENFRT